MMNLHHGESCLPCILKFVGLALEKILYAHGTERCGGCGRTTLKYKFAYWFPWGDDGSD
jgi:hypothetical protein